MRAWSWLTLLVASVSCLSAMAQPTGAARPEAATTEGEPSFLEGASNDGDDLDADVDRMFDPAADSSLADPPDAPAQGVRSQRGTARRRELPRRKKTLAPLFPNGFQRFVQASTGQLVPLFGTKAFEQGFDFSPPQTTSVPAEYTIGPGDELLVQITGIADAHLRLVVDRQGRISLPKVGTVSVVGLAAKDLEPFLDRQLRKSFKNFTLSASLGAVRPIDIYVVGHARSPGRHTVSALSSLLSTVMSTGGPNGTGSMRRVELVRAGTTVATLDVYAFVTAGKTVGDVRLLPGDTVVYPAAGPRIALLGDVNEPAVYELRSADESLAELFALVGGLPVTANRSRALVERIDPAARAPRSIEAFALDDVGLKKSLRDGDVITVLPISQAFDNAVTLRGNVAAPMRYPHRQGMRVRDLIPDRESLIRPDYYQKKNQLVQFDDTPPPKPARSSGVPAAEVQPPPRRTQQVADAESTRRNVKEMLDEVNWEYAVVERLDPATLTTKLLPFHLGRAVLGGDEKENLELEPGDVVTVFSARDLQVPQTKQTRLVRIEGEVKAPGIYQVSADETLTALLERVGGFTEQAYVFGLALRRESVRRAQQETLDGVLRQLEDELRSHLATRQANLPTSGDPAQMAAFQAQLQFEERFAMERMARLRAARPEGRIALELDPDAPSLPAVTLEDGDAIVVPPIPSFVKIMGAVQNENGLLWKEGRTVGEYLSLAGVTPTADLDNIYVLRADGSVRSRDRGFFSFIPAQNHDLALEPGDVVIVPERLNLENGYTVLVRGLKDWTQILANMGIAVASVMLLFR